MLSEEAVLNLLVKANNELDELHGSYNYVDAHTYMEGYVKALRHVLERESIPGKKKV